MGDEIMDLSRLIAEKLTHKRLEENKKRMEEYNDEYIKIANKTSRSGGASAKNPDGTIRAVVPKYVMQTVDKDKSILDFGAGKTAEHTKALRDAGYKNVTAYDFGSNLGEFHDANALSKTYDVVFASNVLNVSSDEEMLRDTLTEIRDAVKSGGKAIFNYPGSPRKAGFSAQEVAAIIKDIFGKEPKKVGSTNSAPIWEITK